MLINHMQPQVGPANFFSVKYEQKNFLVIIMYTASTVYI